MKVVKIAIIALFMSAANVLCAQGIVSVEEKASVETKELVQKLGLNQTQEKTVSSAVLQRAKQVEVDKEKYKGDKEGLKTARKQSNDTFEKSVKTVLTPDQKIKFEQILKEKL
jgi:ribosomal protein L19E